MRIHTVYTEYSACLPTLLNPLAERTCSSQVPCHCSVNGSTLVANYVGGNICALPILDDGSPEQLNLSFHMHDEAVTASSPRGDTFGRYVSYESTDSYGPTKNLVHPRPRYLK